MKGRRCSSGTVWTACETGGRGHAAAAVFRATVLASRGARLALVLLLGLALCGAAPLFAQYTRNPLRTISGPVTDGSHEPLRGAVVQIEAADTMTIQSYVTDERGEYHFRNLRSDTDFTLWATFRGIKSKVHSVGKFDRQLDRKIPLVIELVK